MRLDDEIRSRYPHLQFRRHWELGDEVLYQLGQCDAMVDAIGEMPMQPAYRQRRLRVSLNTGAQATTAIEGNTLTPAEVEKVSEGIELPKSKAYQAQEVANILKAMNGILEAVASNHDARVISAELIRECHRSVGRELGEHFDAIPGRFREDERVVGTYKCPRHEDVPGLVDLLCEWLPVEFGYLSGRQTFRQAVVQAIVTHVYLEWIHPFGDGNGRTGRLLEFYILLRAGNPDIASHILSNHYNETRSEYYRQLERASKDRDLTAFVRYAVQGYHDGLVETLKAVQESMIDVAWRYLVHSEFARARRLPVKKNVVKRRRDLVLAMEPEKSYPLSQLAVVTTEIARQYATLSSRTLHRDVADLSAMKLLVETSSGEWRTNMGLLLPHFARRRLAAQGLKEGRV